MATPRLSLLWRRPPALALLLLLLLMSHRDKHLLPKGFAYANQTVLQDPEYTMEPSPCIQWSPDCFLPKDDNDTSLSDFEFNFVDVRNESSTSEPEPLSGAEAWRLLSSLSKFLLSNTTLRQLYIIHDQSAGDVDVLVQESHLLGIDTIVLVWESSLALVESILRSNYHVEYMRHVFLLCSNEQILHVFEQVRQRSLETPTIQWYVMARSPVAQSLAPLLREGTQACLSEPDAGLRKYRLLATRISPQDTLELQLLGYWSLTSTLEDPSLKEQFFPSLDVLYNDFQGRRLTVAVIDNWPFFQVQLSPNEGLQADCGIDVNILNAIADKLNFTYQLTTPADSQWGIVRPDGVVNGMIGMLVSHEAHLAIDEITITGSRETVVDFSVPYFIEATTILSRAPKERSRSSAIFWPFNVLVWFLLAFTVILIGPLAYAFVWSKNRILPPTSAHTLEELSFNAFRNFVVQGNRLRISGSLLRSIAFTWFFFCFLINALYAGTLTAFLTIPAFEKPLDSLQDLLEAANSQGLIFMVRNGSSNEALFQEARSGLYKEVRDVAFKPEKSLVTDSNEGLERVDEGNTAYIHARLAILTRTLKKGASNYHLARRSFHPQAYGVAFRSGSPFRFAINKQLRRLSESGLVDKWVKDELGKLRGRGEDDGGRDRGGGGEGGGGAGRGRGGEPSPITLSHLQAAFYLLFFGWFLALGTLVGEIEWDRRFGSKDVEDKLWVSASATAGVIAAWAKQSLKKMTSKLNTDRVGHVTKRTLRPLREILRRK